MFLIEIYFFQNSTVKFEIDDFSAISDALKKITFFSSAPLRSR